jgi:hypothetical protein
MAEEPLLKRGRRPRSTLASSNPSATAAPEGSLNEVDLPPSCRLYEAIAELGGLALTDSTQQPTGRADTALPPIQRYLFARSGPCLENELQRFGQVPASLETFPVVDNELDWRILGDLFQPLFIDEEPPDIPELKEPLTTAVDQPDMKQSIPDFPIIQRYQNAFLWESTKMEQEHGNDGEQSLLLRGLPFKWESQRRRNAFASLLSSPENTFTAIDYIALLESSSIESKRVNGNSDIAPDETTALGLLTLELAVPWLLQRYLRNQYDQAANGAQSGQAQLLPDGLRDLARTAFHCARIRERMLFPDWVMWIRKHLRLPTRAGLAGVWLEFELMRLY